jgi:hypothetical protein
VDVEVEDKTDAVQAASWHSCAMNLQDVGAKLTLRAMFGLQWLKIPIFSGENDAERRGLTRHGCAIDAASQHFIKFVLYSR